MSNTNNQSLGKLAKNTAKGLVRVPLQGIKTATNVTNHTFKGISKASKAVESSTLFLDCLECGYKWRIG